MRLEYIREFGELAKNLNFLETSKRVCITQPALSNHIKTIEDELGVTLLMRGKGTQPQLTKAGKTFLTESGKMLAQYDSLVFECQRIAEEEANKLIIALPFQIRESSQILMNEIKRFKDMNPKLDVTLTSGSFAYNPIDGLLSGEIDCCLSAFCQGTIDPDTLLTIPLLSEEVLLWVDSSSSLASAEAVPIEALKGYNIVSASNQKARIVDEWIDSFLEGLMPINHVRHYVESFDDWILNAGNSQEFAILPAGYREYSTFKLRTDRTMRSFDPPLFTVSEAIFKKDDRNPASIAFKDHLLQRVQSEEWKSNNPS